ncbi:MAG: QsdR family transcriptional regulator [Carbonactinosporaceae bacterium]
MAPDVTRLVPEGTAPPCDIPENIFKLTLETFLSGRRLDMSSIAAQAGIGRSTLYRWVGSRDRLIGAVVWYLIRGAVVPALSATVHLRGSERVREAVGRSLRVLHQQPALRQLLDAEPECALRVCASGRGPVQSRVVAVVERLLAEEEQRGQFSPVIDRRTLALVIVRVGDSFLYADAIAGSEPDIDLAVDLIGRLVRSEWEGRAAASGQGTGEESAHRHP